MNCFSLFFFCVWIPKIFGLKSEFCPFSVVIHLTRFSCKTNIYTNLNWIIIFCCCNRHKSMNAIKMGSIYSLRMNDVHSFLQQQLRFSFHSSETPNEWQSIQIILPIKYDESKNVCNRFVLSSFIVCFVVEKENQQPN